MKKVIVCMLLMTLVLVGCAKDDRANLTDKKTIAEKKAETVLKNKGTELKEQKYNVSGKVIVIDAGHGINSYNKQEPIAPNSATTKIAFASGTRGANQTEEELNLEVSLKLQKMLEEMGAKVYMTRTEHNSDMTNVDRAEFANKLKADISVKIHADGSGSSSVNGVSVLVPGTQYISDTDIIEKSRLAGEYILTGFVAETGANNRGISVRNDLTGFNWTKVPIVLVEMGFMTNPEEDRRMGTDEYQDKMIKGIVSGLEKYFETKK